jgi:SAM-dependent methyltransferase
MWQAGLCYQSSMSSMSSNGVRACPACTSRASRSYGTANGWELVRCSRCSTLFTSALPVTAEETKDYAAYYHEGNLELPDFIERRLEEIAGEFEPYRRNGRWLDIGCGAGGLMRAASRRGWTAVGTEVAPQAAEAVRAQGFEVHLGALEEASLEEESFDVVSLVEVLEHVPDPAGLLEGAAQLIRRGGVVYVTTPNGRGISARLLRTRWSAVVPPEHLHLLSVAGLKALFERSSLEVRRVETHGVNPHELLDAVRRRGVTPGERVSSAYELNEALSERRSGAALKSTVNGSLNALRLGDGIKATAERPG